MDSSRDADLLLLHKRAHDPNLSLWARQQAYRNFVSIQRQVSDRKLTELRHRLVRAHRNEDYDGAEKIEKQLKEYSYRHGYKITE